MKNNCSTTIFLLAFLVPFACFSQTTKAELQAELERQIEFKNHYSQEADKLREENKNLTAKVNSLEATIEAATDSSGNVKIVQGEKFVYCKIVGVQKFLSTKVVIALDYGQERKMFKSDAVRDENGKVQSFNSMIDALNYMGEKGWECIQTYTVTHSGQTTFHYLLKKKS